MSELAKKEEERKNAEEVDHVCIIINMEIVDA